MSNPIITIHDLSDNSVISREMNESELADYLKVKEKDAKELADKEALLAKKEQLLERLGITDEEAKLLLS